MNKLIIFLSILFSGCATFTAPTSYQVNQNPGKGLVVVSLQQSYPVLKWMYRNLEEDKGTRGLDENFISTTDIANDLIRIDDRIIYPFMLEPGKYEFFRWTTPEVGYYTFSVKDFSIKFEVKPDEVTYIGSIVMIALANQYFIGVKDREKEDVAEFLKFYPNVFKKDIKKRLAVMEKKQTFK